MTETRVPVLTAGDLAGRLDWLTLVEAITEGHRRPRAEIGDLFLTHGADSLVSRAARVPGLGSAAKTFTVTPGNADRGLPSVQGALLLFAETTGRLDGIVDSALVTRWKTAADSLLGARLLARPDSRRLLIVGAGEVAAALVEAYRAGFPELAVNLWARNRERAQALADVTGADVAPPGLAAAVGDADIVACATLATEPVLHGAWLRPGQHLDLIGAYRADMREADDDALRRARIFVDSFDTTLAHIGELKDPLARGVISRADVLGDLYDLVADRVRRDRPDEITLFKNGGGAHLDLMTGRAILEAWQAAGASP